MMMMIMIRIEMGVLSVVAQQIHTIQHAVANNIKSFQFEGVELSLNPSCSIFITMNTSLEYTDREVAELGLIRKHLSSFDILLFIPFWKNSKQFRLSLVH